MGTKVISNNPSLHDLTASSLQQAASLGNLHATKSKDLPGTLTKAYPSLRDPLVAKDQCSINARYADFIFLNNFNKHMLFHCNYGIKNFEKNIM